MTTAKKSTHAEGYTMDLRPEHTKMLLDSAITREVIEASGIKSTPAGIQFPWSDGVSPTVWQFRPDEPGLDDDGNPIKYLFPKGTKIPLNRLRDDSSRTRVIIAEGTKQQYAVLSHAPADFAVYGMSGCWGFKNADLTAFEGREVFLLLDADVTTNPGVYAAAEQLTKQLKLHGAKEVAYVATTGTGKQGVDDVLASFSEARRADMLRIWLSQSSFKLGKRPRAKRPAGDGAKYFRARETPIVLQPQDVADDLLAESPAALTAEDQVALYTDGVYRVDGNAALSRIVRMFGNYYTPSIRRTVDDVLKGRLHEKGLILPERMSAPLLNCTNTMVNLRTGETTPHDPRHMSSVQVTVEYDPTAAAPVYEAWLREALRQDGMSEAELDALVDDIEEVAGTMLDPSKTPSKALFLFGPSRSGKSTFLRLLKAIAGATNTSAVTLHDLVSDPFAKANLYGKMLNVAADLSNKHVSDLSIYKMITGEDAINGNRKYGNQFTFTNQALVAFSANELPTVSEASRAYAERTKPFEFPNSFAGREDKHLEDKLMDELPGILARWVHAYGRFLARGGYAATHTATQNVFEAKSDRVVQFLQDMCTVTPANYGQKLPEDLSSKRRDVATRFNEWAERNGGSKMGERAFFQRLASISGVTEVRNASGGRCFNIVVANAESDDWDDAGEPQPDPIEPSGVALADSWAAPQAPVTVSSGSGTSMSVGSPQAATDEDDADPFGFDDPFLSLE